MSGRRYMNEAGPQPIPISEILAYAEFTRMTGETERSEFLHVVSVLDRMWLEDVRKQREKNQRQRAAQTENKVRQRVRR